MSHPNDTSIFSVMAVTGMAYIQAWRHVQQRSSLGYSTPSSVIGRKVQKLGHLPGSPFFQNGELEEVVSGFVFDGDDLWYSFSNGETILCASCTLIA